MSDPTEELQLRLDEQAETIAQLQEAAERQKREWEQKLAEESYDAKVQKFNRLYKEAFGTDPPAQPAFGSNPALPGGVPPPEEEQSDYDKKLASELEDEGPKDDSDPVGDPILAPMAKCLEKWFRTIHSGIEIQETLKSCIRPENATALKVVKINDEVKKKMERPDEIADNRMRWLCTAVTKTAQPLTKVWASLSDLEFELQQAQPADHEVTDAMVPITRERSMNLSAVIKDLKHGIKCLGMVHVQCVQKRRLDLKDKLQGAAKEMAEPNQPFDDEIFGVNMEKRLSQILAANKVTAKITSPTKKSTFLARGRGKRGGSRGSHFRYNNQQRNQYHNQNWSGSQWQYPPMPQPGYQYQNYPPPQQGPPPPKRGHGRGRGHPPPNHHHQRN